MFAFCSSLSSNNIALCVPVSGGSYDFYMYDKDNGYEKDLWESSANYFPTHFTSETGIKLTAFTALERRPSDVFVALKKPTSLNTDITTSQFKERSQGSTVELEAMSLGGDYILTVDNNGAKTKLMTAWRELKYYVKLELVEKYEVEGMYEVDVKSIVPPTPLVLLSWEGYEDQQCIFESAFGGDDKRKPYFHFEENVMVATAVGRDPVVWRTGVTVSEVFEESRIMQVKVKFDDGSTEVVEPERLVLVTQRASAAGSERPAKRSAK